MVNKTSGSILVTGSSGLVGSESVRFFADKFTNVIGIDNNYREYYFGKDGSTLWNSKTLKKEVDNLTQFDIDIRNKPDLSNIFKKYNSDIKLIIHAAAQPSHDWAAREPITDFTVNALGTLYLLALSKEYCPDTIFIFISTNKVYGDRPNQLPLIEKTNRWELDEQHPYSKNGIDENMPIDQTLHSVFGASKVAADIMVQEYGKYFGLKTGVFRAGCITGPSHSGAQLHGFLAYLVKCAKNDSKYTILGYKGKQVRDNIHSYDLINMFWHYYQKPNPGQVYNVGGGIYSNCSILEAVDMIGDLLNTKIQISMSTENRIGDHIWWISDTTKFCSHYPGWHYKYDIKRIIKELVEN